MAFLPVTVPGQNSNDVQGSVVPEIHDLRGKMDDNAGFDSSPSDNKATYVLSNVVEVVERILTFVPTKSLLRIAR